MGCCRNHLPLAVLAPSTPSGASPARAAPRREIASLRGRKGHKAGHMPAQAEPLRTPGTQALLVAKWEVQAKKAQRPAGAFGFPARLLETRHAMALHQLCPGCAASFKRKFRTQHPDSAFTELKIVSWFRLEAGQHSKKGNQGEY